MVVMSERAQGHTQKSADIAMQKSAIKGNGCESVLYALAHSTLGKERETTRKGQRSGVQRESSRLLPATGRSASCSLKQRRKRGKEDRQIVTHTRDIRGDKKAYTQSIEKG